MSARSSQIARFGAPAVLLLVLGSVFGDALMRSPMPVLSAPLEDGERYFSVSRAFGFGEIARGNLPLWNPHVFLGVPYAGGGQAGLFYPGNLIYLVFPLPIAMNLDVLVHVWLLGLGMYCWVRAHGVSPVPAVFAGVLSMLTGPYFLHVSAGHLPLFNAFAWMPFFFLALDRTLRSPSLRDAALGVVAVSMMLLTGYPQPAYMSALLAGIYLVFQLGAFRERTLGKVGALAAFAVVPGLAAAAQLAPMAEFGAESVRANGVDRADSFEYALLPHHLIRAVAPGFYGGTNETPYWGGGFPLESGAYLGTVAVIFAFVGVVARRRGALPFLVVMAVSGLLALGPSTPVAPFFHDWVPGFDRFRAPGRYWMFVAWFGAVLAAIGLQRVHDGAIRARIGAAIAGVAAVGAWASYGALRVTMRGSEWTEYVDAVRSFNGDHAIALDDALAAAAQSAPAALMTAALFLTALTMVLAVPLHARWRTWAVVVLGCVELAMFARAHVQTFDSALLQPLAKPAFAISREQGARVLNLANNNDAMRAGASDISGYEPGMLARTDRFLSHAGAGLFTRGADGSLQGNAVAALLRCAFVLGPDGRTIYASSDTMPRFWFVTRYEVIADADQLLSRLYDPGFDPRTTVLLEGDPAIARSSGAAAAGIIVMEASADETILEITAPTSGVLVCSDAYSTGWRAEPLDGSAQDAYAVVPAYHALRGIPLEAGRHRLRMVYRPASLGAALWISIATVALLNAVLGALVLLRVRGRLLGRA